MENSERFHHLHKFWSGKGAALVLFSLFFWIACAPAAAPAPPEGERAAGRRLNILVSNDDGIEAPGIVALAREMLHDPATINLDRQALPPVWPWYLWAWPALQPQPAFRS